jgi:hypothetical protein
VPIYVVPKLAQGQPLAPVLRVGADETTEEALEYTYKAQPHLKIYNMTTNMK